MKKRLKCLNDSDDSVLIISWREMACDGRRRNNNDLQ